MTDLVGTTLGRYEIVGHLGSGGMGEVYRAVDTRLGRDVAIKVISKRSAENLAAIDRFEREARTVAQLSHPNILDIHDFGRDGDVVYAVTELLEGRDLRDRMRGSPLPVSKVVEIGIAVAEGLAAAHSKGIVHRDIKPENVFVTSTGQVKILDFGVASLRAGVSETRASTDARTESLTSAGVLVGTAGYMSPEQVRGEKVDARSDIFSLGCLIYEVVTGQRAFRGETTHDTFMAILNSDPEPIATVRPGVSPTLELLIRRCLEKQPDERFESARDVAFALKALTESRATPVPETLPRPPSRRSMGLWTAAMIVLAAAAALFFGARHLLRPSLPADLRMAVLPISESVEDDELAVLASGLTETITDDLTLLEQTGVLTGWVIPRSMVAAWGEPTVANVSKVFDANLAVSGALTRSGSRVRLNLTLVAPQDRSRLRRARIEDQPGNVHSFQREPILEIARMLGVEIDAATRDRLVGWTTTMAGAWNAYVRARGLLAQTDSEDEVHRVVVLLQQAVEQDPLFAAAHVAFARACARMYELTGDEQWIHSGLEHGQRATRLGGRTDEGWRALAAIHRAAGRLDDAADALDTALAIQPANFEAALDLGRVLQDSRRYDAAENAFEKAVFMRPAYWPAHDALARLYLLQGRYEPAANQFRYAIDCAPRFAIGYVRLAATNLYMGHTTEATTLLERSIAVEPTYAGYSNLGTVYFQASRFADAAEMYQHALEDRPDDHVLWGNLAVAQMFGDQPESAPASFRRAVELAEAEREEAPDDPWLCTQLADYYAMLGEFSRGLEVIDPVVASDPTDPRLVAWLAEVLEDLNDRERALQWVRKAFAAGVEPSRFEGRPTLRGLVADDRYTALVEEFNGAS